MTNTVSCHVVSGPESRNDMTNTLTWTSAIFLLLGKKRFRAAISIPDKVFPMGVLTTNAADSRKVLSQDREGGRKGG